MNVLIRFCGEILHVLYMHTHVKVDYMCISPFPLPPFPLFLPPFLSFSHSLPSSLSSSPPFPLSLTVEEENCLQLHADIETSLKMRSADNNICFFIIINYCSLECYKVCESLVGVAGGGACEKKLKERLGNAWNELGVYYKQVAAAIES